MKGENDVVPSDLNFSELNEEELKSKQEKADEERSWLRVSGLFPRWDDVPRYSSYNVYVCSVAS